MPWLLDTNILSEVRRPRPEPRVLAFIADQALEDLYVSTVTLAELRFGIESLDKADGRRDELNDWLTRAIRPMFDQRILPITEDIMLRWRFLVEEGRKAGHTFSQPDLIIAASIPGICRLHQPHRCEVSAGPAELWGHSVGDSSHRRTLAHKCLGAPTGRR